MDAHNTKRLRRLAESATPGPWRTIGGQLVVVSKNSAPHAAFVCVVDGVSARKENARRHRWPTLTWIQSRLRWTCSRIVFRESLKNDSRERFPRRWNLAFRKAVRSNGPAGGGVQRLFAPVMAAPDNAPE